MKPPLFKKILTALLLIALGCALSGVAAGQTIASAKESPTPAPPAKDVTVGQSSATAGWPSGPKRFALIIGIDAYEDNQLTPLKGASNDAKALREALVRYAGFDADQITVLASDQPEERKPTRGNILRKLSNMKSLVPKDGLLLVAFSGHGIERDQQAFLLPSDAQVNDDVDLLEQTAINVTQMKGSIERIGVGQVVMLLDACRNNPRGRSTEAVTPLSPTFTRAFDFERRNEGIRAFATLYATAVGHPAFEYSEMKQGYFTWALVEGMKGGAARNGEITLASLVHYVQERVPKRVKLDLGANVEQRPFAIISGYRAEDLVIAATGGDVEAVKEQNIRKLMKLTRTDEMATVGVNMSFENLKQLPFFNELPPRALEIMREEVDALDFAELLLPIYNRHFTGKEIHDLLNFYETPLGQKLLTKTPVMFEEINMVAEALSGTLTERAIKRMDEEKVFGEPSAEEPPAPPKPSGEPARPPARI
ncbi:MAG TPA: caspase family protein [Pyrinomonadaceae bacterium]|nr:caspase family protein [Pyrinomonadaceae bacterium]